MKKSNNKNRKWFRETVSDTEKKLETCMKTGLKTEIVNERLNIFGNNEIIETGGRSALKIIFEQLFSTMVLILIVAVIISAFLGDHTEVIAIAAIVVLFVTLGFVQEYRAEKAMSALKKLSVPLVRVLRDGLEIETKATKLVPGDVVILEAGNIVPADARIIESANLRVLESALTGESEPIDKSIDIIRQDELTLGDRKNMVYMGTIVNYGRGKALVTETGMDTELGKIATLIQNVKTGLTPLQKQLDGVGKLLAVVGAAIAVIVMFISYLQGGNLEQMLLTAVSVAVAVVPEGLPAIVTITLALGAQRMLKRHALIRKLPAVETLGSVNIICSDKTGTLTENRMTVTVLDVAGKYLDLANRERTKKQNLKLADDINQLFENWPTALGLTLTGGTLCNDSSIKDGNDTSGYSFHGDPTEGALLVAAKNSGISKSKLEESLKRVDEIPFDSDRKRMTTLHEIDNETIILPEKLKSTKLFNSKFIAFTKGSVDGLLKISSKVLTEDGVIKLDDKWNTKIEESNNKLASNGVRVLGLALKSIDSKKDFSEEELIFVGLIGMIDPPRQEVKKAVHTCKTAGIRPIMITGDHPLTAKFIADDIGIANNGLVKTGLDLDKLDEKQLQNVVSEVSVYARVSPEHKLRIVKALQELGNVVGMTGDGVNDSPALKKADIGIAMGITGTDVTKEVSEMILLDDNFATIVASAEEGRVIYDNIKRFIYFSVAGNLGKVLVMLAAPLFGAVVALLPLQLLWLNLLTDGLLGLGLGVETSEDGVMKRPPRSLKAKIFDRKAGFKISWIGILIGLITVILGWIYFKEGGGKWQTMMFTALAFLQIGQALAARSDTDSFFSKKFTSNPLLLFMIAMTIVLQLCVIYIPFFAGVFNIVPLSLLDIVICAALGILLFFIIEIEKIFRRKKCTDK
ncbi:MAG: cation-translocating P-type ATPase [bacterium]|nr:cation-translocating P-type ATPase [bacterium]